MTLVNDKTFKSIRTLTTKEKTNIQQYFVALLKEMTKHGVPDISLLKKAFNFAVIAHGDARRKTGEPYIMHPLHVAKILADCGHESDMVAAAILHDVVEDCNITKNVIENEFGINIADIVDAVTSAKAIFALDESLSKFDLDTMSDAKFLNASAKEKKAVYIKCAERIHNLRTVSIFPEEQQKAKAYHTRNIVIPAAKKLHIHKLVDILEDLCLRIENPQQYQEIYEIYTDILKSNKDTFKGTFGLIEETKRMILEDGWFGRFVTRVEFNERGIDSIRADLFDKVSNAGDMLQKLTKEIIPLYDVYFISRDIYMQSPDTLFFAFYDKLHQSRYRFTIIGHHEDEYETYYIMKDWFGSQYRLFVQSETEHMEFTHGLLGATELNGFCNGLSYVDPVEPGVTEQKMISVFKKDGSPMSIVDGATVLDFAFAIDPNIGICAKYAFLNGGTSQTPIYVRLKPGDMVEIICDHNKEDQSNDCPHATVRWFEYLHSREAIKALSRWLEKHMDSAVPSMIVYDLNEKEYEIDMASTVLDFAFVLGEQVGLHIKNAYINRSHKPVDLNTTLRYGDKVRIQYDLECDNIPSVSWLSIVKTRKAKESLIRYFKKKFDM